MAVKVAATCNAAIHIALGLAKGYFFGGLEGTPDSYVSSGCNRSKLTKWMAQQCRDRHDWTSPVMARGITVTACVQRTEI